jgi:hypothetical protein
MAARIAQPSKAGDRVPPGVAAGSSRPARRQPARSGHEIGGAVQDGPGDL